MDKLLHVGSPNVGCKSSFYKRLDSIFSSNRLTNNGPMVRELESKLKEYLDVKHFIAINNGTTALEIAIHSLELTGEVILPSFTFVATAHALKWLGLKPVFCDIDPLTLCLCPDEVEKLITPNTSAILGVHIFGNTCKIKELELIAKKYSIKLFFDAAHAFSNSYKNKKIGNFGECEVFSFHATKFFNTFEGGAVATNNDYLAKKIKLLRNFGFVGQDEVQSLGINGKMSEVSAAMGLTNFESIEKFININKNNYQLYMNLLNDVNGIKVKSYKRDQCNNFQYIVLLVNEKYGRSRDDLMFYLQERGVRARRYFWPACHKMQPYESEGSFCDLLNTEKISSQIITLPTGTNVTSQDIYRICKMIKGF